MGSGAEHRDIAFAKKETADLGVRAAVFLMLLTSLLFVCKLSGAGLLHFVNDSLESGGVVDSEVSENLTVQVDTSLVQSTHELRIAHTLKTGSGVDTLNPQCAEVALL